MARKKQNNIYQGKQVQNRPKNNHENDNTQYTLHQGLTELLQETKPDRRKKMPLRWYQKANLLRRGNKRPQKVIKWPKI